ncbi:MAG: T9SS type A sorting domain-containing protein, partial [Bacteroidales bacterium]
PNPQLWEDQHVFVNNTYPIYAPTIGVATLDALDKHGNVYAHANHYGFSADTLTSRPIRLDSNFNRNRPMQIADSLYFSFYYQPGGGTFSYPYLAWERIGDQPEPEDMLLLEFGYGTGNMIFTGYEYSPYIIGEGEYFIIGDSLANPYIPGTYFIFQTNAFPGETVMLPSDSIFGEQYIWNEVWSTPGCSVDSWLNADSNRLTYFKQVMIPIRDEQYFKNNFQFRFRNFASLEDNGIAGWTSNVDQWHIDYIQLKVDRDSLDLYPDDVAFVSPTTSFLTQYQSMPWHQYRSSDLKSNFHNNLSNLYKIRKDSGYEYTVLKNGAPFGYYNGYFDNIDPYYPNGLQTIPSQADPAINFTPIYDHADSAIFTVIHHFFEVGGDKRLQNDTCRFDQKFYNYYAYDDGTAEAGYTILSSVTNPNIYFAMRFTLAQPDTLRSVRMWFNSVLHDANFDHFTLMVWDDFHNEPGNVLYSLPAQLPAHAEQFFDFIEYRLEEPLAISGTFYIGFYQNHSVQLNLGFDQNNDAREHFIYKTGTNWKHPFLKGAPMIRPVVGKDYNSVGIEKVNPMVTYSVYPNPASDFVNIKIESSETDNQNIIYELFDIYGRKITNGLICDDLTTLPMGSYASGVYLLKISEKGRLYNTTKIIKR